METGSLGEKRYHFHIPGSVDTLQVVPARGFDVSKASREQLKQLRIPEPPDAGLEPAEHDAWTQRWSRAKFADPGLCVGTGLAPATTYGASSTYYSGVRASTYAGHPYSGGYANNRVFVQNGICTGGTEGETSWVGLQSYPSPQTPALLQAGSYRSDVANNGYPRAFYENISSQHINDPVFSTGFSLSQGDLVQYTTRYYDASVTNSGMPEVYYFWQNVATGVTSGVDSVLDPTQTWYSATASNVDFVDEKQYPILTPWTSIGWSGAYVTTPSGTGDFPGNIPHGGWYMQGNTLDANLDNGLSTSSNWNNYWHGCN